MNQVRKWNIIGGRVIKTGIAVFLTVLVCEFFNIPTIFAVITAIVTIEPTATDSIKKGLIRFPASTIGSAYAMTFTFFPRSSGAFLCVSSDVYNRYMSKTKVTCGNVSCNINCCCNDPNYGRSLFYCIFNSISYYIYWYYSVYFSEFFHLTTTLC